MSDNPGQDYFVDGIVEEIITTLSRMSGLFVIARNSSFKYKNCDLDVRQIGRELGVRYVLEGSVRKAVNLVRISAQLVDASTGANLWADRFDGEMSNILDLQDQVAVRVVGMISPKLEQAEIERTKRKPIASLDAYDYYLRGMASLHKFNREANADALSNLHRAIELDPEFAPAYGQAARCYAQRRGSGWVTDRKHDIVEATKMARRAIDLGKDDAVALCTAGFALADVADEMEDGDAYIDRALALNPNLAIAWLFSGCVKISLGDPEGAISRLLHAMRLSPQDSQIPTMQVHLALAHLIAGRYEEAYSWAEMAVRGKPNQLFTTAIAAASSALAGRHSESQKMMQRLREAAPLLRLSNLKEVASYLRPKDFDTWSEGLRKAGLPE
jgi:TolB-like protein/Flp pilus assembly protein TadD